MKNISTVKWHCAFRKKVTVAIIWITRMIKQCGHCIAQQFFSFHGAHCSQFSSLCTTIWDMENILFVELNLIVKKTVFSLVCELGKEWKIACNCVKQYYKWDSYYMYASKIFMCYLPHQFGSEVECTVRTWHQNVGLVLLVDMAGTTGGF
jgi:hypothetical protein